MEVVTTTDQETIKAIKNSNITGGYWNSTQTLRPEDIEKNTATRRLVLPQNQQKQRCWVMLNWSYSD